MATQTYTLSERITSRITNLIRLALVIAAVYGLLNARWSIIFATLGALVLSYVPQFLARKASVNLPLQFQFAITLFIYASIFLGEVGDYYEKFWWWDVVLHGGSAFAFGFIGFLIMYLLYARNKITASPFLIALFSLCFGVAIGAIWEILEFVIDNLFGTNMQRNGLRDTMWDLIIDTTGAGIASIIGYIYLRFDVHDPFDVLVQWFVKANPHLLSAKTAGKRKSNS